jgi:hypothetical protein
MPSTYTPISTQTLTSATASVSLSSIPSTYTDLVVVINAAVASGSGDVLMTFNSNTSNIYNYSTMTGNGSSGLSTRSLNRANIPCDYNGWLTTTLAENCIINIMNYYNTTTFKTVFTRANNAGVGVDTNIGVFRSRTAINQITFTNNAGSNFITGSTFSLYGIKAA